MATFLARYPSFKHDPSQSSSAEFYRLCDFFGWGRDDDKRKDAHDGFKTALVQQFDATYGTDASDIATWAGLCTALGVKPLPATLEEATKNLRGRFVNLVDLVDRHNSEGEVIQFRPLQGLQDYTIANGKFFPKESAYAGGVLKFLLRDILG